MTKDRSPFSPGKPVEPEAFVGREEQIRLLERATRQAKAGSPQYLFITGERGIGKSSLASFGCRVAEKEAQFLSAQVPLGGAKTVGEACRRLYQAAISQLPDKTLIDKAKDLFGKYVERVDLFGIGVEFKKDQTTREELAQDFVPYLYRLVEVAKQGGRQGLFLVADDLNGIVHDTQFAHFIKSVVDEIAVGKMRELPLVLVLVGVPERMEDLKAQQPSIDRIFQPIELPLLTHGQATEFFRKAFASVDHTWSEGTMEAMSTSVGGHPVMWHELGDAVFWEDQDEHITEADVTSGVIAAAEAVGRKYLQRPLYEELRSDAYQRILAHIGSLPIGFGVPISRAEVLKTLPEPESRNFDNFIKRMRDLGVLEPVPGKRGQYRYTHFLYFFYIALQSSADASVDAGKSGASGESKKAR